MTKKHIHYDMKKLIWSILFMVTFLLPPGCYDEINNKLDELEGRVDDLTILCEKLNKELATVQALVEVIQSQDMITGVTEIRSGTTTVGYKINFVKHEPVTITNGENGLVPIVSSREYAVDGNYYWTVQYGDEDWKWLQAADGSLMLAIGVLPQITIRNGYFYITTDGVNWTQLGKADGENGDQMFHSVVRYEDYVAIRLTNGQVLQIPYYTTFLKLQDEYQKVNDNAAAQMDIVTAARKRLVWITSIRPILNAGDTTGLTVTLSNGRSLSIHDWTSSLSPSIFIKKHSDGHLYWAYSIGDSGEKWVLSPEGQMIPAESEEAEIPTLSVQRGSDGNFYWTVTTNGSTEFLRTRVSDGWAPHAVDSVQRVFLSVNDYRDSLVVMLKDSTKFVLPKQYTVSLTDVQGNAIGESITMKNNSDFYIRYTANGPDVGLSLLAQGGFTADKQYLENGDPCIKVHSPGSFQSGTGKVMAVFTFATSTAPVTVIKTITIEEEEE